ncbi:TM0106 family RecB-like putative nuclease [Mastigocladus laminosus UU774]|nr:TM0106 family RecB-like putative nuclease [Mastigocladus laminosus UU774]
MLISAELLLQYHRCKRRPYLDIHGDFREIDSANDLLIKLQRDKIVYQKSVLREWNSYRPSYPQGDWYRGQTATIELMQQGVECIYHGVLLTQYSDINLHSSNLIDTQEVTDTETEDFSVSPSLGFPVSSSASPVYPDLERYTLLSRPDLLVKKPGQSCFGDWMYVPVNIELGKRPKQEYQTVAAFHTQVLAMVQQAEPEVPWLILRGKETRYPVDLIKAMPQMHRILWELIQTLETNKAPEIFISRQKCNLCHWYSSCYAIAQSQKHLSLLPGITPVRYTQLQALEITTLESLAQTSPTLLENLPGFDSQVACKVIVQAQSVIENRPLILPVRDKILTLAEDNVATNGSTLANGIDQQQDLLLNSPQQINPLSFTNSSPDISTAPIELYFDIEAQPDLNLDYLLGVLVVDRQTNTEQFYSLLAENLEDEGLIWQQFLNLVWQYPNAPIYHFCVYESDTVKRLAKLYHTPHAVVQPILNRFVDVYEKLTQSVALPVESYALKAIARWLGFEWRHPEASGAKCIYWYDQWLKTGDRTILKKIQSYNEDDCRATRSVKDWLVNFFAN